MSARAEAIAEFLAAQGYGTWQRAPLPSDASLRRYERLSRGDRTRILMDIPPGAAEDLALQIRLTGWLHDLGLSAPEVLAADIDLGAAVLEDFGQGQFARLMAADPGQDWDLYRAAIEAIAVVGAAEVPDWLPPYSLDFAVSESRLAVEWYAQVSGADLEAHLGPLLEPGLDRPCVVLRDCHVENLFWLPDRQAQAKAGLIDFQGALVGARAYDIASLATDVRRDVPDDLNRDILDHMARCIGVAPQDLRQEAMVWSVQRNLKILGLFTRLAKRDGKPGYLALMPRVWGHLQRDLQGDGMEELRRFVATSMVPPGGFAQ